MAKRLHVGNLPIDISEDQLHEHCSVLGQVDTTKLITYCNTGRSRGYSFVEMSTDEEAKVAIEKMNKSKEEERELVVNEARPRPERSGSNGGGRGGFGGGRGGYGGNSRGGYGGGYSRD